ncbi:hypothetical protein KP79_PYT10774 [Mizuhopecten yessoensis]|uniref:Uncharacterized protein n=1 Tax=Mizuhopecten yessoensis TaxID=6573 RepID=A0A210PGX4_MIZYE|nr:hypothetical protein KP79_PYT10774 [Mizuhopecten yessoensis]
MKKLVLLSYVASLPNTVELSVQGRRELQRVRDEHKKAEEERQLREEELWRLHESHKQEIEQQRHSLTEIADENLLQHQRAEEELVYARDCLQQEREAFQQYLQEELAKVQKGQTRSEFGSQTEVSVVQTAEVGCDQELQDIERRKESLQGQIKALAQGELIRRLSYRETEQRLLEEAEEIEDQYQTTQEQLNAELQQLEEVEKGYRTGDRSELQDITRVDDDLSELDRQQQQLHLYIEEKQGLMQVGLDVPRPLRSACSEEVLTDTQNSRLGFPYRASSLLALKQGSEGDLPTLSSRLSLNSSLNITSLDSIPDSVESMDTSPSPQNSTSNRGTPTGTRKRSTKSPASDTLTSGAKEVTSRLYTAPPPKFKYEPKQKSKVVPKTDPVRKRDGQVGKGASAGASKNISSLESKKGAEDGKTKTTYLRKSKSPSPGRATAPLPGGQTSPSSGREISLGSHAKPSQKRQKASLPESTGKGEDHKEKRGACGSPGPLSEVTKRARHISDESGVIPRLRQSVSQPILNRGLPSNKVPLILPPKLRPINSATSLASVPEAVGEETEALDHGQVSDSPVVRRRKKRQFDEDDTRRHSEPVGESLADAFENYTKEMEASIEIPCILLHHDSPGERVWARQHSSSVSDSDEVPSSDNNEETSNRHKGQSFQVIPRTADLEVTSYIDPDQQVATVQQVECYNNNTMAGDSTAKECVSNSNTVGSSVDGPLPGKPTDNQCNVNLTCDVPTEVTHMLEIKPCKVDDNVFRNDLEYQQEGVGRSVELDSDSGFYPESSDNFESSGAHSFAGSIKNVLGRSIIESELDPQGSVPQTVQTGLPGAVSVECDANASVSYNKALPMYSDKPVLTGTAEGSDIMEGSLTSPADVSLHLSESQDSESDSGNYGRKRGHDSSPGDFQEDIPTKCKKQENRHSDNVYLECVGVEHMEVVVPEQENSQNIPQSSTQNLNAQFTLNPNFQASSGFVVCDILQDAAQTISAELYGAHRSYSSDSLEDADSLDGSRPRATIEQELTDSLEDSDVDNKEQRSKHRKKHSDTGSLQGEQQTDTGSLQGEQQTVTGSLQGEQQTVTGSLQGEQQTVTGSLREEQQTINVSPDQMVSVSDSFVFKPNTAVNPLEVKSDDISQHVNHSRGEVSIGVDGQQMELAQEYLSATGVCDTNTSRGQVISVTEATPTQHYPDTNQSQEDKLVVKDPLTFTPIKCNKEDSSSQTNLSSDMNFKPINNAVEELHGQVPDQPSTRSLGIVTTPDRLTQGMEEEENVGGASDCSHDSIQDLQEQLQQLEEFPGQKGAGPNANPSLSSSRRATRHRAMIRQKRRGVEESDDFSPESGDSIGSGNVSKPSSRPDSASKRRRRIVKSKSDRRSNLKAPSSEDYVNSESDDVCSDDSHLANESGDLKDVQPDISDESEPSVTYSDFAQQLSTALDEQKESIAEHDSVSQRTQTCDCAENSEELSENRIVTNLKPEQPDSEEEFKMDGHHMNGVSNHGDDMNKGAIPKKSKRFKQRNSNGSSTSDLDTDMRRSSRTPSETRDMEQQTDVSWLEFPDISPSQTRRKSPVLHISPLSVWNSGDRGVRTSKGPHGSGGVNVSMDSRHIKKTKRTKPVSLQFTTPDVWSADTWVENYASSGKLDADISSDSDDDHAYVMETEVFSPQSPTACDKFFDDGDTSDTKEDSNSVKYYVTINEENTNISYNVDRTEYKTYSLRSQIQPNEQTMSIPESININLTATDTHTSESRHTSSNSQRVYLNNSDQTSSSPEQNIVVSERSFRTVHEASRDEDDFVERHFEEEASASYLELCPGTSTPHPPNIFTETGDINKNDILSPRESETTSDYGTMIMDNRRDFTSFTLDSGDEEGSLASGYKSYTDNQDSSPLDDKVFALPSDQSDLLLAEMGSVPEVNSEDVDSISQNGQRLCSSEHISRRNVVAGSQHLPCEPEMVSNVLTSEQIDANSVSDDSSDIENSQFVEAENVPHSTNIAQQVIGALARMSALAGVNKEDSEDLSVSLDRLQGPESVSSDSSIYKTPQQSPRDEEEGDTAAIENVEIPDQPQSPQLSKCMKNKEALNPPLQSQSKAVAEDKTVSVTTDPQSIPCARRKTVDDSSVREDLKRELQQKLARLQKHVRSLSDSAISSDYTDGDSTSVSPRGSRLYESDKTLRGGLFVDQTDSRYPEDIRVMATQTRTQFDPAASGQPFSSTVHRLLEIDNKTPKKSPLKDSGNVFDDSDLGEQVEDTIVPERVVKEELCKFVPIVKDDGDSKCDDLMNASAIADSRSLSPGELMLSASCSSGDIFESVGSGSSDLEEVYRINTSGTMHDQWNDRDDGIVPRSLPGTQRSVKKEKSPSMSDIASPRFDRDLKRSMSEANVDDFEEITTSSESSNDSIVFVFMGQSHTTESMEKLQNEYNPLPFGNDSEPVYHPSNWTSEESTSSQPQLNSEGTISKIEEQTSDYDLVKSGENCSISENQITLESKKELKPSIHISENQITLESKEELRPAVKSSPDHTGECGYKNYDDDDNEPLRHRFGIDEAVLPIPERSVSSDNIPKQTMSNLTVHRSRSTDLLEVNPVENPNDPSNNEGIFPPNVDYDFWDDSHGYHGDVVVIEEYYSDDSDTKKSSEHALDKSQDRFIDEEHIATEEIPYSELSPTHQDGNRRVSSEAIDYNGNMHGTGMLDQEEQYVGELYTLPTTGPADTSRGQESGRILDPAGQLASDNSLQTQLTDTGTQTEVVECSAKSQEESHVLPALASPYRAQSMGDINPADSSITLTLPEGTENWENLSHMVIESTTLINNINQKIAGVNTTPCSSKEMLNSHSITTGSRPARLQANVNMESQDDTTQTTRPLTDLHDLAIQTDDEWMLYDREDSPDNSNDSTQTDTDITRPRELSETETNDIISLPVELPVDYDRVFPPEPSKEMSSQTSPDTTVDTIDTSMQTDEFEKVLTRLSHALKNDDSQPEEIEEEIKSSYVDGVNAQKTLKLSSGHVTSRVQDQAVTEYNKQEHHLRKHNSKQDQTQTVIIERQSVIETEANVPDMDVTNAEMEALKAEHVKMMESLKKAAEGRKIRTHDLKARLEKQTQLEKGPVSDRYTDESNSDTRHENRNMTSWHETHLSSDISLNYDSSSRGVQKDVTLEQIKTSVHTEKETEHVCDESGDLDSIFKDSHQYLGSNDSLENIDDLLVANSWVKGKSRSSSEPVSTKSVKGRKHEETSVVCESPTEIIEDLVSPVCKSNQQATSPSVGAEGVPHNTTEVTRLDSLSNLTSEGTLLGEEVSRFLNDDNDGRSPIFKDDSRFGAENRALLTRNRATSEPVDDEIGDREGSPQLQTPPNSPVALSNGESRKPQYKKPQPYRRSPEIQPNYLATLRKQPPITKQTETSGQISTGVEVSVDSSDDFTQTDLQSLKLDLSEFKFDSSTHSETRTVRSQNNPSIKSKLSILQKERVEIIELLSMNYLPASLTVELLEAKLNYCIGQTDTLLKTLEETWDRADFNVKEIHDHHHTNITREYVTNYRFDLQKSKRDIQICKEKINCAVQPGVGRGRTLTRNKDIAKWKRLEEIEAFKTERFMEQHNYERARSISPLKKMSSFENERYSRSVSPSSTETSPRLMTAKQHRTHLVDLRRSLVEVTERDEHAYRASRSCSPQLSHYDDTDRIHSPRSSSYNCSPQTSPVHNRYSPHISPEHHYMQPTSISPRASPERHNSPCISPEHQLYRTDYGSTNSLSVPDQHTLNVSPRSYSHSPARTYTQSRPDVYNGSYLTPRVTSASPQPTAASTPHRPRSSLEGSRDRELRGHDQLYALQETKDLFRDMQEARMRNQQEITRAQNTLLQSTRNYSNMRSRTSSNASSRRSYSSYRDYARDLIEGSQRSIHGMVSGSYELYDTTNHGRGTGVISPPSSVVSDLESLPDSILSEQYASNATTSHLNTDPSFIRTRPINSADIKSRIRKQRKIPLTS